MGAGAESFPVSLFVVARKQAEKLVCGGVDVGAEQRDLVAEGVDAGVGRGVVGGSGWLVKGRFARGRLGWGESGRCSGGSGGGGGGAAESAAYSSDPESAGPWSVSVPSLLIHKKFRIVFGFEHQCTKSEGLTPKQDPASSRPYSSEISVARPGRSSP